jgi:bacillolysin
MDTACTTVLAMVSSEKKLRAVAEDPPLLTLHCRSTGVTFKNFALAADVVGHELAHGWTSKESNLIYNGESGALNEAMSDIIGASVERIMFGKSVQNTWLLAEDLFYQSGSAIRNMANPNSFGDYDYYPTRYLGSSDNGGVHWNSGIANL